MLYFYNQSKHSVTDSEKKSKSFKLQLRWYKMMCKQWHLMDHCILAQRICHPQLDILTWYFKTSPMGNSCGKHGAMNSIYWQIMQYKRAWALLFPLQTDLISQLHHIIATLARDFLIESPQKQRFCSSYNEVQTFAWSSAVTQSTEFIQFAVDNVNTAKGYWMA